MTCKEGTPFNDPERVVEIKANGKADGEERKTEFQLHLPKFGENP
jgi:hypothetical protein